MTTTTETIQEQDICNLMLSNNQRLKILSEMGELSQFEAIKKLIDIYRLFGVKKIEKFLLNLCIFNRHINLYLKQDILYILKSRVHHKNKIFIQRAVSNTLFLVLQKAFEQEEYWLMLNETLKYVENLKELQATIQNIIILGFKFLNCEEPFKKIFLFLLNFKDLEIFMDLCTFIFINFNQKITVKNNLQILQIIYKEENKFMDNLFQIANDINLELSLRLEACDILYLNSSIDIQIKVQNILETILPVGAYTNNSENVHLSSVIASVDRTLDILIEKYKSLKRENVPENLHQLLLDKFNHCSNFKQIQGSLNRIFNYNFLKFSKYKLTLKEILYYIWFVIEECEPQTREEIYIRMKEEFIDMYDTCSQGYVTRLINILSGFEINGASNLGIAISYEDQIYGIFSGKINTLVRDAPDPLRDKLLEELMVPSNDHENRLNLIRYLRPYLPQIWNEIFNIFKDILTITDLDLYCRKVTMKYEGV